MSRISSFEVFPRKQACARCSLGNTSYQPPRPALLKEERPRRVQLVLGTCPGRIVALSVVVSQLGAWDRLFTAVAGRTAQRAEQLFFAR